MQVIGYEIDTHKLLELLWENHLSVADFADILEVQVENVSDWLAKKDMPTIEQIKRIEKEFDWPLHWYLKEIEAE